MNDNELDYIPLHVRSCYSINDGLQNVGDIVKRAAKLGCPAIAVTDFNNMAGFVRFYNACYGAGDAGSLIGFAKVTILDT